MAQILDWPESLVWSQTLVNANDFDRFKALHWGIRTWNPLHIIQAPMSSERFNAGVVSAMQKKKILGVTSRYVMLLK